MITIKGTDTQSETYKGKRLRGLSVLAVLLANAAGTAMTGVLVDQSKIRVTAKLYRGNDKVGRVIYNEQIRYANAISSFSKPDFIFFQNSTKEVLLANATGVIEKAVLPMIVDFGKPYVLEGNDRIYVEINTTGCFSDSSVSSVTSYLELTSIDSFEGIDDCDTEIVAYNIQAGKSSDSVSLGDGVTDIMFYNSSETDILEATAPLSNISINAKEFKSNNNTFAHLLGKRLGQFSTKAESDLRYSSFYLYSGQSLTDCRVDMNLVGANVDASACYLIYRRKIRTPNTLIRGVQTRAYEEAKQLKQAGLYAEADKVISSVGVSRV